MDFDPANRELCPDGACIGVIGPDGRCKECGAVGTSVTTHSRLRGMELPNEPVDPVDADDDRELCPDDMCIGLIGPDGRCKECGRGAASAATRGEPDADPTHDTTEGDDDDDRRLCPDGMCIGLIGPDGRCKECGTPAGSALS